MDPNIVAALATLAGVALGSSATFVAELLQNRREERRSLHASRELSCIQLLEALVACERSLDQLARAATSATAEDARAAFLTSGVYEARERVRVYAPSDVVDAALGAVRAMRCWRDGLAEASSEGDRLRQEANVALAGFRAAVRGMVGAKD